MIYNCKTTPHAPTTLLQNNTTPSQNKQTAFNYLKYILHIKMHKDATLAHIKLNKKCIHTAIFTTYMNTSKIIKLIQATAPLINSSGGITD